jgi:hypothetical protein
MATALGLALTGAELAVRVAERATRGLRCTCGHARQAHRHYRPGSDCSRCGCGRWTWKGWRGTHVRRADPATCPHPDGALTVHHVPPGRAAIQTCGRCGTQWAVSA